MRISLPSKAHREQMVVCRILHGRHIEAKYSCGHQCQVCRSIFWTYPAAVIQSWCFRAAVNLNRIILSSVLPREQQGTSLVSKKSPWAAICRSSAAAGLAFTSRIRLQIRDANKSPPPQLIVFLFLLPRLLLQGHCIVSKPSWVSNTKS